MRIYNVDDPRNTMLINARWMEIVRMQVALGHIESTDRQNAIDRAAFAVSVDRTDAGSCRRKCRIPALEIQA